MYGPDAREVPKLGYLGAEVDCQDMTYAFVGQLVKSNPAVRTPQFEEDRYKAGKCLTRDASSSLLKVPNCPAQEVPLFR